MPTMNKLYLDGLVQNRSNSIANALELLQSCTKPSISLFVCIQLSDDKVET